MRKFYTGLGNFATLVIIILHVFAHVIPGPQDTTSLFDQIHLLYYLNLIKLHLSSADQDIGY